MIDRALEQKPADFDALLKLLSEMGCEVSRRGKAIRLKAPGWKNVARMDDKLGAGYSEAEIRAVLAGEKQHTPRKKSIVQPEPPKVNLLVDIQAKLQAGKGAGYARWAKVFNLKQMAQTVNFLTEHHLLDYAELAEKAAAATAHHNELSAQIKAAEKRMAEIAVLRTHIVNYAKTRETYVAYRKAGYSKKFREEHEEEILLHQAAKNAFDEMGVKKLPKVKDLQAEYAKLLEEKKKTYAEYRRSREEMRELLTAKANVDRLLKMDLDMRNAAFFLTKEGQRWLTDELLEEAIFDGKPAIVKTRFYIDLAKQILKRDYNWKIGTREAIIEHLEHRLFFPQEIAGLLSANGFEVVELFDKPEPHISSFTDIRPFQFGYELSGRRLQVIAKAI